MAIALLTLALVGTVSLAWTMIGGHRLPLYGTVGSHFLSALVTTLLLVMAHSFIMFFLIATGVSMKEMEKEAGWGDTFRRRTVALKGRVFPVMTSALLLVIANFVLGAAAHTRALPTWVHGVVAWTTLATCMVALWREYQVLGENNRLIAEAGSRREDTAPRPPA